MKLTSKLGVILLSVWLILQGLATLVRLSFEGLPVLLAILAIAAGVLLLIDR